MTMMHTISDALDALRAGKMIVVIDDEDREHEGDLVIAAESVTAETIRFMAKEASGLICVPLTQAFADRLQFPLMVSQGGSEQHGCWFTVSVDAREHITTGISAEDRARTIRLIASDRATPGDFVRPGHVFPLIARDGGVFERAGHTESACDLIRLAGFKPVAAICEIMLESGHMARTAELMTFAEKHGLVAIRIRDLIAYRREHDLVVEKQVEAQLPTAYGDFRMVVFQDLAKRRDHVALVHGDLSDVSAGPALVRVHSECTAGDLFGSQRCDCHAQLDAALTAIGASSCGVLVYVRDEGRGIGLVNTLKSYNLQDEGYDTVEANLLLGFADDERSYAIPADILRMLGAREVRLLTNNPRKSDGLTQRGIRVVETVAIEVAASDRAAAYMRVKKSKLGHMLHGV